MSLAPQPDPVVLASELFRDVRATAPRCRLDDLFELLTGSSPSPAALEWIQSIDPGLRDRCRALGVLRSEQFRLFRALIAVEREGDGPLGYWRYARRRWFPQFQSELIAVILGGARVGGPRYRFVTDDAGQVRPLGQGGTARVFRVENLDERRPEALKVLLVDEAGEAGSGAAAEAFRRTCREVRAYQELTHPHIPTAYQETTTVDELTFFTMQFIEGASLNHLFAGRWRPGREEAVRVARRLAPVADAVARAHGAGIVHRGITPANLIYDRPSWADATGHVYLVDFGFSRFLDDGSGLLTMTRGGLGTRWYAAPEQLGHGRHAGPLRRVLVRRDPLPPADRWPAVPAPGDRVRLAPEPPVGPQPGSEPGTGSHLPGLSARRSAPPADGPDAVPTAWGRSAPRPGHPRGGRRWVALRSASCTR